LAPDEQHFLDRLNSLGGFLEEASESPRFLDEPATVPTFDGFSLGEAQLEPSAEAKPEALEFEWNTVDEAAPAPSGVSFADLNEPAEGELISFARGPKMSDTGVTGELKQPAAEEVNDTEGNQATSAMMRQELDSVDFYITQGYSDIAFDTLELLERQFGPHPDIDSRRKKLEAAKHDPAAAKLEFSEAPVSDSEIKPGLDLATADIAFGEIVVEPANAQTPPPPVSQGLDSGLAEIFEEFRMEAEGEGTSSNEDYETHYNMATAYKEMDLLDEAIREFQVAAGLTGAADGTPRYFQCCNMLGHCFAEKGMPQAAVSWFKKGLDAPGRSAEESKALNYELGAAYEQMGDLKRAVAAFTDVYGVDISYRDIGERLESLHAQTASKTKKGK
jgi:tetratricopeptide (TPR) repeat protein